VTKALIIVRDNFTNTIHTHTAQLHSCAETHEVALGLKVCGEGEARGIQRRYKEGLEAGDAKQTIPLISSYLMRLTGDNKSWRRGEASGVTQRFS
jgi:hypothetical protein